MHNTLPGIMRVTLRKPTLYTGDVKTPTHVEYLADIL